MKKFAISLISSIFMMPALAHHGYPHYSGHNYRHYHNHHHNRDWVVPAVIITGAIVASEAARRERELARQEEIIRHHDRINNIPVSPPVRTIIIEKQPVKVCTEWKEIQDVDGRIYRERICRND